MVVRTRLTERMRGTYEVAVGIAERRDNRDSRRHNVWSCCTLLGLKRQARARTNNGRTVIDALTFWKNSIPDDLNLKETFISTALILLFIL
jgi:hypothetical protein